MHQFPWSTNSLGMFIGTAFTLFVVPAIYSLLAGDHSKARNGVDRDADITGGNDPLELLGVEQRAFVN